MFSLLKNICLILCLLALGACSQTTTSNVGHSPDFVVTHRPPTVDPASHSGKVAVSRIEVSIAGQYLLAYMEDGSTVRMPVRTARPGHITPTGSYRISDKIANYASGTWWCKNGALSRELYGDQKKIQALADGYAGCPMPFAMRVVRGIFIHAGNMSSGSAGCIRLHYDDAEWLFRRTRSGTLVSIS